MILLQLLVLAMKLREQGVLQDSKLASPSVDLNSWSNLNTSFSLYLLCDRQGIFVWTCGIQMGN